MPINIERQKHYDRKVTTVTVLLLFEFCMAVSALCLLSRIGSLPLKRLRAGLEHLKMCKAKVFMENSGMQQNSRNASKTNRTDGSEASVVRFAMLPPPERLSEPRRGEFPAKGG